jgi:hypothetical protein
VVAQLVGHDGQELVLAPLRLPQRRRLPAEPALRLTLLLLGLLPLRPVGRLLQVPAVAGHAGADGLVQDEPDGHHLPAAQRPVEPLFEVIEDDEAQDLVVADDLGERPAALPALLAVFGGRRPVPAVVFRVRLGEAAAHLLEERGQVVEEGIVVGAGGVRLLLSGAAHPALDD